jgi:phage-related protein (TIGR01555 family)
MDNKKTTDGLTNVASGLMGRNDKSTYSRWDYPNLQNYQELEACYLSNWIASNIIDIPTYDACSKWRTLKCKNAEQLERYEKAINYQSTIQEAVQWSQLFGGSGIIMLTGQNLEEPFDIKKVKKGILDSDKGGLIVFDRFDLTAYDFNYLNPVSTNYMQPNYYRVRGGKTVVHHSHIAKFYGKKLSKRFMVHTQGWGDSYLRRVIADINDIVAAKGGISHLMQEANVDVFKAEDLWQKLASQQDEAIMNRYQNLNLMKSAIQGIVLDKEEDYERKTLTLSGVSDVLDNFMIWVSAASGIPVTKLFGTSAKGLNATGEGDMKNYYDKLTSMQNNLIAPPLKLLDKVMSISATGTFDEDFDYTWNSLHQQNELQMAEIDNIKADMHLSYLNAGIITPPQIMRELQTNETYQFDDNAIVKLEKHYDDPLKVLEEKEEAEDAGGKNVFIPPDPERNADLTASKQSLHDAKKKPSESEQ